MATTAYFSGVESQQHWQQCVSVDVRHVLMSYFQFYKGNQNIVKTRALAHPNVQFMIDSGAHTFITDSPKFLTWKQQDFEDYVAGYADWLKANRKYIRCAVEFDIDYCLNVVLAGNTQSTLGSSIVESWQNRYFKPLEKLGLEIIYVWHEERKLEGWEDMCQRHSYVGLPGAFSKNSDFNKYMTVAKRYSAKVHGFAATKQKDFRDIHWYSVDSITWKTGEMYGTLIDWDPRSQKLQIEDDKTKRARFRPKLEALGFDADGIINDTDYKEVTRYSLFSMRSMEAFYKDKYKDRIFYYELRLPLATTIRKTQNAVLREMWAKFRPDELFKSHVSPDPNELVELLCALSAVQHADGAYLNSSPTALPFLKIYFPKLADPLIPDLAIFQKELAAYISPTNPAALPRESVEDYTPENNPPRHRVPVEFNEEDLVYSPSDYPLPLE